MAAERREVDAITANPAPATFENTVVALDQAGELLARGNAVFSALVGADTNDKLQAINREASPLLSAHRDDISLDPKLFQRVNAVWAARAGLKLDVDQQMLLERTWKGFVRDGAELDARQAGAAARRERRADHRRREVRRQPPRPRPRR